MIQEPRIWKHLPRSRVDLINETVQAHRYALSLNQDNADVLFNTAQVLTTAAETAQEARDSNAQNEAVALLKEAVELFSSCLSRQELDFTESQTQADMDPTSQNEDEGDLERMSTTSSQPPQEWATVVEPVTANTLVETALAELNTLTTLVSLTSSASGPDSNDYRAFADVAGNLIQQKLPQYIALVPTTAPGDSTPQPTARFLSLSDANPTLHVSTPTTPTNPQEAAKHDAALAAAIFSAAIVEAEYSAALCTAETYASRLSSTFAALRSAPAPSPTHSIQLLSAFADALVAFASASAADGDATAAHALRASALAQAQVLLAEAAALLPRVGAADAQVPSAIAVALLRGDVELMRRQVAGGLAEGVGEAAALLESAAGCYGGGGLGGGRDDADEVLELQVKRAVVGVLRGVVGTEGIAFVATDVVAKKIVVEMEEEGLLGESDKEKITAILRHK